MRMIVDIPDDIIEDIESLQFIPDEDNHDLTKAILDSPINVTNGDMMRFMFPNAEIKLIKKMSGINYYRVRGIDGLQDDDGQMLPVTHNFYEDWWNKPYEGNLLRCS